MSWGSKSYWFKIDITLDKPFRILKYCDYNHYLKKLGICSAWSLPQFSIRRTLLCQRSFHFILGLSLRRTPPSLKRTLGLTGPDGVRLRLVTTAVHSSLLDKLQLPSVNTTSRGKNSFKFLVPKLWNMLKHDLRTTTGITYFRNNCVDFDWLLLSFTWLYLTNSFTSLYKFTLFLCFFLPFLLECSYIFIVFISRRY